MLRNRPDVKAAELRLIAADHRLAAAIADRFPSINLSAGITGQTDKIENVFSQWISTLAGSLTAPVFDAGRRKAEADRNRAVVRELFYRWKAGLINAFTEVEDTLVTEEGLLETYKSTKSQVELAEMTLGRSRSLYVNGLTDYLTVLTSLRALQNLERAEIGIKKSLISNRIKFHSALGGDWPGRLVEPEHTIITDQRGRTEIMNSRILRTLIFLGILAIGFLITAFMMINRITPEKAPVEEHITPVTVLALEHGTRQVKITGHGTVTPAREVRLQPEVSGRVTEMSRMLIPGGVLPEGAMLVRIDQSDYRARYEAGKEQVSRAALNLKQEQARQAVAREEWELLGKSIPEDEANQELALRIPQIESAKAALTAAESALAKAKLDLERCTVKSPFNAPGTPGKC